MISFLWWSSGSGTILTSCSMPSNVQISSKMWRNTPVTLTLVLMGLTDMGRLRVQWNITGSEDLVNLNPFTHLLTLPFCCYKKQWLYQSSSHLSWTICMFCTVSGGLVIPPRLFCVPAFVSDHVIESGGVCIVLERVWYLLLSCYWFESWFFSPAFSSPLISWCSE